ncbi:hypothetical protein AGMMS50239_32040 [Bacteroidia bacterium]|nr:hypothetical protein AGMMS50239_32040 [Bacteroidia bacterium]
MKSFFIHLSLLLSSITILSAQTTLQGTVLDTKTKEPVAYASVYLDGTTIGTATDLDGRFSLTVKNRIHTRLVVSFMGYESVVISNPYESIPEIIYLDEKDINLGEVIVWGKPTFTEKQKMEAFKDQFLGMTEAGYSCKILNEDVIRLSYNPETNKLYGYADVPIEIENKYLGYKIRFELIEFTLHLKRKKSLALIDTVSIIGLSFFEDLKKNEINYAERREKIYKFSSRRFFKLLAERKIELSDFRIYNYNVKAKVLTHPLQARNLFALKKNSSDSTTTIVLNSKKKDDFGIFNISVINVGKLSERVIRDTPYKTIASSKLHFFVDTFSVDKYGNTNLIKGIFINGIMGKQRVGDTMPTDYLPQ